MEIEIEVEVDDGFDQDLWAGGRESLGRFATSLVATLNEETFHVAQ